MNPELQARLAEQLAEMQRIRPRADLVLVRQDRKFKHDPDAKEGSLFVAQIAIELPPLLTGEVIAVGKGAWHDGAERYIPHDVAPGMRVRWEREWGTPMGAETKVDDVYLMIRADRLALEDVQLADQDSQQENAAE